MRRWITTPRSGMMLPDADGFERNTTIEYRQQGTCGNVAGNGVTGDVILLSNYCRVSEILGELHVRWER